MRAEAKTLVLPEVQTDYDLISRYTEETAAYLYLKSIYDELHRGKLSHLLGIVGRHRAGKSLAGVTVSALLDPTFIDMMELRVVYYPDQFMQALNDIRERRIVGAAIVWDEAGIGFSARAWYEMQNRLIGAALQVVGYLRPLLIFVTQDATYIDVTARKLMQGMWVMHRHSTEYSRAMVYEIRHNRRTGKIYYYHPRIQYYWEDGSPSAKVVLRSIKVYRPPRELEKMYEEVSNPWKDEILQRNEELIEMFKEGKLDKKQYTPDMIVKEVLKNWKKYQTYRSRPDRPEISADAIRMEFGIPRSAAKVIRDRVMRILKKKAEAGELWEEMEDELE